MINAPDRSQRGSGPALVAVGVLALAAALMAVFIRSRGGAGVDDPYHYGEIARGLLAHGFDRVTRRAAMLYPQMLALIYGAGGGDRFVLGLHCVFHAGTSMLAFLMGRRLYNRRTAVLAGVATALHPMLLRYIPDLHTEAMLVFATTLTVWCSIRFYDRPTVGNGIVLGVVGMVGTLIKGVVLPVVLAFAGVWVLLELRAGRLSMRRVAAVLAIVLSMAAVVAPWTYRNYKVSGRFVLLTPGTADAFLRGYIFTRMEFATLRKPPYTYAENESNAWFHRIARDAGTTWEKDEIVDEDNNKRVMKQMIVQHPVDTARKFVVGLFTFWYEMTSLKASLVPAVLAVAGWIFAAIGLRRARTTSSPVWLLLLPIVVVNVLVAALIPLGRYSVPILPCLCTLAAAGVDVVLARSRA